MYRIVVGEEIKANVLVVGLKKNWNLTTLFLFQKVVQIPVVMCNYSVKVVIDSNLIK